MLRASVSLSRKISRDFNSTGYTVAIDGEVPFPTDDAEGVLEKVSELFNLAQEALDREISRDQGENGIGGQVPEPRQSTQPTTPPQMNGPANGQGRTSDRSAPLPINRPSTSNGNPAAATPKQLEFLKSMARRFRLSDHQLDNRIAEILGRPCNVQQLTKKEAGLVLDNLTGSNVKTGG
jgi:hypothetical protein